MSTAPRRLGKYELQQLLGSGSVGETWKGYDFQTRSDVVIKLIHTDLQADSHFLTHFLEEGQKLCALHHPHLVQVRHVSIFRSPESGNTTPLIEQDYIDGPNLTQVIAKTSHAGIFSDVADIVYLFI
ncbi:MAG: protein kinase, partial [Chloroflexota bacterium]|nr:protein kinase [Chloroflexota bacterium]